jgi:hypothetical protein
VGASPEQLEREIEETAPTSRARSARSRTRSARGSRSPATTSRRSPGSAAVIAALDDALVVVRKVAPQVASTPCRPRRDVLVPGPWTHRDVSANGTRFHVAESGERPARPAAARVPAVLVVVAPPARRARPTPGCAPSRPTCAATAPATSHRAATTRTPSPPTSPASSARSARSAAFSSGTTGARRSRGPSRPCTPRSSNGSSSSRPRIRCGTARRRSPTRAGRPSRERVHARRADALARRAVADPRRRGARRGAARRVVGPGWPTDDDRTVYRQAMLIPGVAHCSLEYYRWWVRSLVRPTGYRFFKRIQRPVTAPTLQLHGALDTCVLPRTALGSGRYVEAQYEWRLVEGAGPLPARGGARRRDRRDRALGEVSRDRNAEGRPENARPRDATGKPLDRGAGPSWRERLRAARRGARAAESGGDRGGGTPGPDGPAVLRARGARRPVAPRRAGRARVLAGPRTGRRRAHARPARQRRRRAARCCAAAPRSSRRTRTVTRASPCRASCTGARAGRA